MPRIYFSLQEANELIQKIRPKIQRIIQLRDEIELLDNTQIQFDEESIETLLMEVELNKSFHEKNIEMYSLLGELIRQGCIIKELNNVEIDFYSRLNNRDIAFCWKPTEEKIMYWHFLHETCDKRQTINIIEKNYMEELKKLR
jgi:hypothetical protein